MEGVGAGDDDAGAELAHHLLGVQAAVDVRRVRFARLFRRRHFACGPELVQASESIQGGRHEKARRRIGSAGGLRPAAKHTQVTLRSVPDRIP